VHQNHYSDVDIIEQDLLEEMPNFKPVCLKGSPYLVVEGNIHQAIWVLTQSQVNLLQEKCSFLNQSSPSRCVQYPAVGFDTATTLALIFFMISLISYLSFCREYMSSFSLFNRKGGHCSLTKLLPGARLTTFTIYHYYQQRHVSWTPVFLADENIRAGAHYMDPNNKLEMPGCWRDIVSTSYAEQYLAPTAAPTTANLTDEQKRRWR
jgi:hypothetical protein